MPEVDGSYLVARTLKEENTECLFYLMGGPNYEIINNSEDFGIDIYDFRTKSMCRGDWLIPATPNRASNLVVHNDELHFDLRLIHIYLSNTFAFVWLI